MPPRSRPSSGPATFLDSIPVFTTLACAACVVVFAMIGMRSGGQSWDELSRWGYLPPGATWEGRPWGLISSVFVHLEAYHIAFNVYWLWLLGGCLEHKIGPGRWLAFFLAAAWVSSALQLLISGDQGIGMSGVGYALFGFGWVARVRMREFGLLLSDQTVLIFVLWLVGCAIATQAGLVNIGNAAHGGGLLFGACVAGLFVLKWKPWALAPALATLVALSVVPLFWCPTSGAWNALQADRARDRKDYASAIRFYRKSLEMGEDKTWALANLASIYAQQNNRAEYERVLSELRKADPKSASQNEDGPQAEPGSEPGQKR